MEGGSGNDTFRVQEQADVITGNGGVDGWTDLSTYTVHQFIARAVYTGAGGKLVGSPASAAPATMKSSAAQAMTR